MNTYEIEVKSLLGEATKAKELVEKMITLDPYFKHTGSNKQLNHYFEGGDMEKLTDLVAPYLSTDQMDELRLMVEKGNSFSVRTRQKDGEVLLVVKASVDAGSSANTVSRMEFERPVSLSLAELDGLLQDAGFQYQAKWSRERDEYKYKGINVCIDRNAGYGYLAEFEKVINDLPAQAGESSLETTRAEIYSIMQELGVDELPQGRLERMFAYYNQNWQDYYGTDRVFVVE